jgi:hypothetical protein
MRLGEQEGAQTLPVWSGCLGSPLAPQWLGVRVCGQQTACLFGVEVRASLSGVRGEALTQSVLPVWRRLFVRCSRRPVLWPRISAGKPGRPLAFLGRI